MEEKFEWRQSLLTLKRVSEQKDFGKYWKEKGKFRLIGIFKPNEDSSLSDKELLIESLIKAAKDPNPDINHFATAEFEKIKQKQTN